ncbi:hypothetical protein D3C81_1912380 [compost metagenome]
MAMGLFPIAIFFVAAIGSRLGAKQAEHVLRIQVKRLGLVDVLAHQVLHHRRLLVHEGAPGFGRLRARLRLDVDHGLDAFV